MKNRLTGQLVFELFLLSLGLVYLFQTITMKTTAGAKTFPMIFCVVYIVSMLLVLKNTVTQKSQNTQEQSPVSFSYMKFLSVLFGAVFLTLITYFFTYWLAIVIVMPIIMFILDEKRWSPSLVYLPAAMVLTIYVIFVRFLNVRL